jgi:hypothetical protein
METPKPASPLVGSHNCEHLRHKGMYVLALPDPGETEFDRAFRQTAYWCTKTQKALGPDGQPAHADDCVSGRGCCDH